VCSSDLCAIEVEAGHVSTSRSRFERDARRFFPRAGASRAGFSHRLAGSGRQNAV